MALMLTYRMLAKKLIPYLDMEKIETDNVIGTMKNLYIEMNIDDRMNFGRLLEYIRYVYCYYDLTEEEEEELIAFLRIQCPKYFPHNSLVWLVAWLIEYALSLMNYDNLLFHL